MQSSASGFLKGSVSVICCHHLSNHAVILIVRKCISEQGKYCARPHLVHHLVMSGSNQVESDKAGVGDR